MINVTIAGKNTAGLYASNNFYIYLFFQIDIFTLNSRENSKQNTHLNGRKLVEDANMTLV